MTNRLTPRQTEVAEFVAQGLSNKEIARKMNISEGTVKILLHRVFIKLRVPNRTALAILIAKAKRQ